MTWLILVSIDSQTFPDAKWVQRKQVLTVLLRLFGTKDNLMSILSLKPSLNATMKSVEKDRKHMKNIMHLLMPTALLAAPEVLV